MKKLFVVLLTLGTLSAFADTADFSEHEVGDAKLVSELKNLNQRTEASVYSTNGICYTQNSTCVSRRDTLNLLSNDSLSIQATCRLETNNDRSASCYGTRWTLRAKIFILQ